jgi:hypothetical protein
MTPSEKKAPCDPTRVFIAITAIQNQIKLLCPSVVFVIPSERFEDEDAILIAYVPSNVVSGVQSQADHLAMRALLDLDVDIAILVRNVECLKAIAPQDMSKVVLHQRAS